MNRTNARLLMTRMELTIWNWHYWPAYQIAKLMCDYDHSFLDAYDKIHTMYKDDGFTTYKSTGATWEDVKVALRTYMEVSA